MHEEEIKIKMDDGAARYFIASEVLIFNFLTCERHSLVSGTQNDIVVS